MIIDASLLTAATAGLAIGLLGQVHCFGMCGGITGALSLRAMGTDKPWQFLLLANLGRLLAYAIVGAIAGLLGAQLTAVFPGAGLLLRGLAALILALVALQLLGVAGALRWLERPFQRLTPMVNRAANGPWPSAVQPVMLGMAWGFLPCGLVYGAVAVALAQHSLATGAVTLLAFGLGTLPGVLALGSIGRLLHRSPLARRSAGVLTLGFALWTLVPVLPGSMHGPGHNQDHHNSNPVVDLHQGDQQQTSNTVHGPSAPANGDPPA